jgi:hypothetical protein
VGELSWCDSRPILIEFPAIDDRAQDPCDTAPFRHRLPDNSRAIRAM